MNVVVCRHPNDNGRYIFKVPMDIELDAGTLVTVETSRGTQPAQCITSTFRADPEIVCPLWGTTPGKIKRVLSFLIQNDLEWPDEPEQVSKYDDDEEP